METGNEARQRRDFVEVITMLWEKKKGRARVGNDPTIGP